MSKRRLPFFFFALSILLLALLLWPKSNVLALTTTPSRTATIGCGSVVIVTATPSPTFTPTPRTATATPTSCGPIYVTVTPTPGGNLTVSGYVHNAITDMLIPIGGAQVKAALSMGRVITATTAADGSYSMVLPGAYLVSSGAVFTVSAPNYQTYTASYTASALYANPTVYFVLVPAVTTVSPTPSPAITLTLTRTLTRTPTHITQIPQGTPTLTRTPTATATLNETGCSPVTSTIAIPFSYDGSGVFCWKAASLGGYVNSWNLSSLTINSGVYTNVYLPASSYPPMIGGYYYVGYSSSVAWGHFEAK